MVLKHKHVEYTDNFFEIGGDSLLALVVIEQIKQRLGWEIDLAELLRYPTIEEFNSHLSQPKMASSEKTLIRMSKRGDASPIIFIHPVSGLIFAYSKLVKNLGQERGCYGIQSLAFKNAEGLTTIQKMAEAYADIIYGEIGEEEFNLCGWSLGGILGYELARIASNKDLNLQKIIMIDSYSSLIHSLPSVPLNEEDILKEFYCDLIAQITTEKSTAKKVSNALNDSDLSSYSGGRVTVFRELSKALFGNNLQDSKDAGIQFIRQLFETYNRNIYALSAYQAMPADVSCLLLHSLENDTVDSWKKLVKGKFDSIALDGNHYDLMGEKYAMLIAEHIRAYIDQIKA
jgi:thioesterase domain-containing protein/aryl carrier-like protein